MEDSFSAPNDPQFYPLYVSPLAIVAPPGVKPVLPPGSDLFDAFPSFNILPPQLPPYMFGATSHEKVVSRKSFSSAIRDYPVGCGPCWNASAIRLETTAGWHASSEVHTGSGALFLRKQERAAFGHSLLPSVKHSVPRKRHYFSPKRAVLEACRIYHAVWRNLLLDEEFRGKEVSKSNRPDLMAGSVMNNKGLSVNRTSKVIGHMPGVEVGNLFLFRMEICCVGMHGPTQGGIDYIGSKESKYSTPVAISIISAGGYDAQDDGDELVYTGQGGRSSQDSKQIEDQKLERGNLAMEGSMRHQVPVRVIRGIKNSASPSGKIYTYDGLYRVEESWCEKGKLGFEEFKFRLRRLPEQRELGSSIIKLSYDQLKHRPSLREGVQVADLSSGKESLPVCVVNIIDSEESPQSFHYSTAMLCPSSVSQRFGKPYGCDCRGSCTFAQACSCFLKNQSSFAYINNGMLVKERGMIHECGSSCTCSVNCRNRVTQRPSRYRFEVFKTENKGWGLRSWDIILAGSFVCEYIGKFVDELEALSTRDYILNLGLMPCSSPQWGDVSSYVQTRMSHVADNISKPVLILDSSKTGNLSRFINHSCSPNLLVQCVLRDQNGTQSPHVMLFAKDNVMPFQELTIDYGVKVTEVELQNEGKACLCQSEDCRKRFGF